MKKGTNLQKIIEIQKKLSRAAYKQSYIVSADADNNLYLKIFALISIKVVYHPFNFCVQC